jgi:superfamily I DNA/RNA helicase
LIDEAQDYKRNWFKILFDYFLEDDGEVVIFGDKNQDVYRRRNFDSIPNVRGHVWGPWTGLNIGHRVNNQAILDLAREFQQAYFQEPEDFGDTRELTFGGGTKYCNAPSDSKPQELVQRILDYVNKEEIDISTAVVLSQTTDILREIEYAYRSITNVACMTTFETKEVFDALLKSSGGKVNSRFKEDLEKVRTNKKAHFTMMAQSPKMSTIYSYKGWEASCVILLILPDPGHKDALENRPELIYTAITRAKDNLFVINLNNRTYHNFFVNQIG